MPSEHYWYLEGKWKRIGKNIQRLSGLIRKALDTEFDNALERSVICEIPNGNTWLSKWIKYKILYTSKVLVLCSNVLSNEKGNRESQLSKCSDNCSPSRLVNP